LTDHTNAQEAGRGCRLFADELGHQRWPDKDSDKRQRDAIQAFAKSAGYVIVDEFYDAGVRGADPIEGRPGFNPLLDCIRGNGVRTIIVETASRLARDLIVQETGHHMLKALGIEIIAADKRMRRYAEAALHEGAAKVHPEFADALKDAKERELVWWESIGQQQMVRPTTGFSASAFIFQMKNRFREDYRDVQHQHGEHRITQTQQAQIPSMSETETTKWIEKLLEEQRDSDDNRAKANGSAGALVHLT
jgi:hypothetical protein